MRKEALFLCEAEVHVVQLPNPPAFLWSTPSSEGGIFKLAQLAKFSFEILTVWFHLLHVGFNSLT